MLDNEPEGGERTGSTPAGDTVDSTTTDNVHQASDHGADDTGHGADSPAPVDTPVPPGTAAEMLGETTPVQAAPTVEAAQDATAEDAAEDDEIAPAVLESVPVTPVETPPSGLSAAETAPAEQIVPIDAGPAPLTDDEVPVAPVKVARTRTRTRKAAAPAAADGETAEDDAPAAPVRRTRTRKTAAPALAAEPEAETQAGVNPEISPVPLALDTDETPAAPVKATRTRTRTRKVAAPAAEPEATTQEQLPIVLVPLDDEVADEAGAVTPVAAPVEPAADGPRTRRRAATPPPVLFMAPEPEPIVPFTRRTEAPAAALIAPAEAVPAPLADEEAEPVETTRRRRRRRGAAEPVDAEDEGADDYRRAPADDYGRAPAGDLEEQDESADDVEDDLDGEADDEDGSRRRRRRGRRGRGRGRGGADDDGLGDDEPVEENEAPAAEADDEDEDGGEPMTRRRRRRRRKGAGDETEAEEAGVHTVVRIREPRAVADEVQGVSGSTRLEAKRQRRRDGREQRRTRPPILSESEFLARREAVDRTMVVRQTSDRTQIAVLEDGILVEHYVSRGSSGTMAGNVYLGKVQNVLPSMEAAFVDIGRGRNAVLYAGEVNWDATGLEGRSRSIEQALRSGDSVLVQVTKDPIGHKGARLTSHIALSGRHLVYVPHGNASGISRKLPDNERKRLRDVLKKMVPDGAGVIVRTAAEGASEDELARDVKRLQAQWEDIQSRVAEGGAPIALYEEPDLLVRVVRDLFNEDFREVLVQGEDAFDMVEDYLTHVSPDLVDRLHRYTGVGDIFADKRIDEQILKGLDRKVFLPSGGHLVIDRTEAMTVVDVNTGKYTGVGGNLEETVTRNNLEAAEEIVRQLRLRDLGGIVVIDFIDMVLENNRELVLRRLTECLGRDRTKHQVTEITSLGLVQMTRKRIGAGLLEAFSETCDHCKGRGLVIHTDPVSDRSRSGNGHGGGDRVKAVASGIVPSPVRTERIERAERGDRAEGTGRTEGSGRVEGSGRTEGSGRVEGSGRAEGSGRRRGRKAAELVVAESATAQAMLAEPDVEPFTEPFAEPSAEPSTGSETAPAVELDAEPQLRAAEAVAPVAPVAPVTPVRPVTGGVSGILQQVAAAPSLSAYEAASYDDTMGYDLSRYDSSADTEDDEDEDDDAGEPSRLAGAEDPDALGEDEDAEGGAAGRRRTRRSTRRRTRP
jgi:ribonuclease E